MIGRVGAAHRHDNRPAFPEHVVMPLDQLRLVPDDLRTGRVVPADDVAADLRRRAAQQ